LLSISLNSIISRAIVKAYEVQHMKIVDKKLYIRAFVVILLLFIVALPSFTEEVQGEIVYIEGSVDIYRDGSKLDWRSVDIGTYLEQYDMVETGEDGLVEILLSQAGGGATVTVDPDTSFYFDVEDTEGPRKTEFAVLAGSMAFKVKKLSGNEAFQVRTESVAMGVRGTEFEVSIAPEGSVLCTTREGLVECKTEDKAQAYAKPGQVVEKITKKNLSTAQVSVEQLDAYRSDWQQDREEVFKRGAQTFIKGYGLQYQKVRPRFMQAYAELIRVESKLRQVEKAGGTGSTGRLFKIKGEVSPAVVKMRSILPMFEHVFFRLQILSDYHDRGYGQGMISGSTSSADFFSDFSRSEFGMKRRLSQTYYLLRLFQKLHDLTGGGPSFMDSPFEDEGGMPEGNMPEGFGQSPF